MKDKVMNQGIILTGIGLAILFWVLESLMMSLVFREGNYINQLLAPNTHEIWMRLIGMVIIIVFSVFIQYNINKRKLIEKRLKELGSNLEQTVKQRTAELAVTNNQLQEQIENKVKLVRALVHELKTPLTPMLGASDMLVKIIDDKALLRLATNVNRGAHNLNRRINDLIDLAHGETGLLGINCSSFDLLQMIYDLVDYMKIVTDRKKQEVILDLPPSSPIVWADEDRIRQVILNLLDNAIKFTPNNGKITLKIDVTENSFIVHIQDTGCGIDKKEQKHLFELYWRSDNIKKDLNGLGIGLPLSKMIIELHGGQIWVKSKKGRESTFSFSIPHKLADRFSTDKYN
ncbi:HAMP domain-containing histidine kinase [Candidatus Pacearchaeota archaeon]|nr:HAMP domain-containing histidine kinase [Candidatus Pacearchaeota archaeon]